MPSNSVENYTFGFYNYWFLSQRRPAKAQAGLLCSHAWSMEVDEGSDQNQISSPTGWLRMLVWRMSTEDEKYHNPMTWLIIMVLDVVLGVCVSFPFYVLDSTWNSIVSVPDYCLFTLFLCISPFLKFRRTEPLVPRMAGWDTYCCPRWKKWKRCYIILNVYINYLKLLSHGHNLHTWAKDKVREAP